MELRTRSRPPRSPILRAVRSEEISLSIAIVLMRSGRIRTRKYADCQRPIPNRSRRFRRLCELSLFTALRRFTEPEVAATKNARMAKGANAPTSEGSQGPELCLLTIWCTWDNYSPIAVGRNKLTHKQFATVPYLIWQEVSSIGDPLCLSGERHRVELEAAIFGTADHYFRLRQRCHIGIISAQLRTQDFMFGSRDRLFPTFLRPQSLVQYQKSTSSQPQRTV